MGSYNQTCGVTRLPICYGDKVVVMLLAADPQYVGESLRFNGRVSNSDQWKCLSFPVRGTYDSYGRIENWNDDFSTEIIQQVCGHLLDDLMCDYALDKCTLPGAYNVRLSFMMVHADIFDRLTVQYCDRSDRVRVRDTAARFDTLFSIVQEHADIPANKLFEGIPFGNYRSSVEFQDNIFSHLYTSFFHYTETYHRAFTSATAHALDDIVIKRDVDTFNDIFRRIEEIQYFAENFKRLRREWAPAVGLGSQGVDEDLHFDVAAWAVEKCMEIRRKYEDG